MKLIVKFIIMMLFVELAILFTSCFDLGNSNSIKRFSFETTNPVSKGIISRNKIAVTVPHGTDLTNLVPTIEHVGTSLSPASKVPQNFTGDVTYRVTMQDGTTQVYTVTVKTEIKDYALRDIGPAGGLIFYINPNAKRDGWKYLECAPSSTEWVSKTWGDQNVEVSGADGIAIGTGKKNTEAIIAKLGEPEPHQQKMNYAAKLCSDLTFGGFSDWFLPSKDELNEMCWVLYSRKYYKEDNPEYGPNRLGDFANNYYWSSSETTSYFAWYQSFYYGYQYYYNKNSYLRVRAIRAF